MNIKLLSLLALVGSLFLTNCSESGTENSFSENAPAAIPAETPAPEASGTLKDLSWMLGTWRQSEKEGIYSDEIWKKAGPSEFSGNAFTIQGKDTVWAEKLRLVVEDGKVVYYADVPENDGPVGFKLVDMGEKTATFENPAHDFPWKIVYTQMGDTLHARIAGFRDGQAAANDLYLRRVE